MTIFKILICDEGDGVAWNLKLLFNVNFVDQYFTTIVFLSFSKKVDRKHLQISIYV